jgi:hypothetical protein
LLLNPEADVLDEPQDSTAFWNGQNMARTEIIPQTSKNIGSGHLYVHLRIALEVVLIQSGR